MMAVDTKKQDVLAISTDGHRKTETCGVRAIDGVDDE